MNSFIKKNIPLHIYYILKLYFVGIIFFTLFRVILFFTQIDQLSLIPEPINIFVNAFVMGLRFDTVITAYILFFPLLLLSILVYFKLDFNWIYKIISILVAAIFSIAFIICATDIPYFNHFYSRLTTAIFPIMNNFAFSFEMILREPAFLIYFFVLVGILFFYFRIVLKITKKITSQKNILFTQHEPNYLFFISFWFLVFTILGARGRFDVKSPIRVGTAYTSNYTFPNQLGLNPVFTFMRSWFDDLQNLNQNYSLMNDEDALINIKKFLNITDSQFNLPIARKITFNNSPIKYNVVLVILESMSADKMGFYSNQKKTLTPFLDKLANEGIIFSNFYSAGVHTYNGLYSIFTSMPSLLKKHTLKDVEVKEYAGLSRHLSENNYKIMFLVNHDDQFDNMGGFLRGNYFHQVFSDDNYPQNEILSNLGVPDHYLFSFGLNEINKINKTGAPFFTAFLTTSDHSPYIIPKNISFKSISSTEKEKAVEYVDWSIKQFMESSSKQSWFDSTIFIFTGDHGANWGEKIYDMPISYHHVPLIIYSPKNIMPGENNNFGSQMDIFPTIMGLLKLNYINNTMGIDLLNDSRKYIYFSADDKIGCISDSLYYINNLAVGEGIFDYKNRNPKNLILAKKEIAQEMNIYSKSFIQSAQWLVNNKKTGYLKYE